MARRTEAPGSTFPAAQIRAAMGRTEDIRNVCVVGQVGHGKTSLVDTLLARAGVQPSEPAAGSGDRGSLEAGDSPPVESSSSTVRMKSSALLVDSPDGGAQQLVHLLDTPGHVDFAADVASALRVSDGVVVVVDCTQGCAVQTESVLRQAMAERVRPVVFVSHVDSCLLHLNMSAEDIYQRLLCVVEDINTVAATCEDELLGETRASPSRGTVLFGSASGGWSLSIARFAAMYAPHFGLQPESMAELLWGDHFYDPRRNSWADEAQPEGVDAPLTRGFIQFILEPVMQVVQALRSGDKSQCEDALSNLGLSLEKLDLSLSGDDLVHRVMRQWETVTSSVLDLILKKLPSPVEAQKYRVESLYHGLMDDAAAVAIRDCDPQGPLMIYIVRMVPVGGQAGRFYAVGRVFSGTATVGQKVNVIGHGNQTNEDLLLARAAQVIQRACLLLGRSGEPVSDVPCGNAVALLGVDQFLLKAGTLTDMPDTRGIAEVRCPAAPVVRVAVKPQDPKDLPKLTEGLRRLSKADRLAHCVVEEWGEHIIAGSGELHIDACVAALRDEHAPNVSFDTLPPVVAYRETCLGATDGVEADSVNRCNTIGIAVDSLPEKLSKAIEVGTLNPGIEAQERVRILRDQYSWDEVAAKNLWCFGPQGRGPNVLLNGAGDIPCLSEIKSHVSSAFQWASQEGPLCEESLRGVRFSLKNAVVHADAIHRGAGQVMAAGRRSMLAGVLSANPALMEPSYRVEVVCPEGEMVEDIKRILDRRRGHVVEEVPCSGTGQISLRAHLPVAASFGFATELKESTRGSASAQCVFYSWDIMEGSVLEPGIQQDLALQIRVRKNIRLAIPSPQDVVQFATTSLDDKI